MNRNARGFSGLQVLGVVALAILVTGGVTFWFIRTYVYPAPFEPIELSQAERSTLGSKLRALGVDPAAVLPSTSPTRLDKQGRLVPEK